MNMIAFLSLKAHLSTAVIQSCNFSIMVMLVKIQNSHVCARAVTHVCFDWWKCLFLRCQSLFIKLPLASCAVCEKLAV